MAFDPEWDDAVFPSTDELYYPNPARVIVVGSLQKRLYEDFIQASSPYTKSFSRAMNERGMSFMAFRQVTNLAKKCALELFSTILRALNNRVDESMLSTVAGACILISIKLVGAKDWIYDSYVIQPIEEEADKRNIPINKKKLLLLEKDILARTNWKGCSSIVDIDKFHDELFKQEILPIGEDYNTPDDYKKMLEHGKELLTTIREQELAERKRILDKYGIDFENPVFTFEYKKGSGFELTNGAGMAIDYDDREALSIRDPTVIIKSNVFPVIAKYEGLVGKDAIRYITRVVLPEDYGIYKPTLIYESDLQHSGSRHSRHSGSRHSRHSGSRHSRHSGSRHSRLDRW